MTTISFSGSPFNPKSFIKVNQFSQGTSESSRIDIIKSHLKNLTHEEYTSVCNYLQMMNNTINELVQKLPPDAKKRIQSCLDADKTTDTTKTVSGLFKKETFFNDNIDQVATNIAWSYLDEQFIKLLKIETKQSLKSA